jgi:hypothetical protein
MVKHACERKSVLCVVGVKLVNSEQIFERNNMVSTV